MNLSGIIRINLNQNYIETEDSLLADFEIVLKFDTPHYYVKSNMIIDEEQSLLYYGAELRYLSSGTTEVGCINLQTLEPVWTAPNEFRMTSKHDMYLRNNILYGTGSWGVSAWNVETGEVLYSVSYEENQEAYKSGGGVFYYEDKLYFTSTNPEGDNFFCVDASTGICIWASDGPEDDPYRWSLGVRPVVYNGVVYAATSEGIYLFNAETGEFLGRDRDHIGTYYGQAHNVLYNGNMIVFSNSDTYAVKLNCRVNAAGELVKRLWE